MVTGSNCPEVWTSRWSALHTPGHTRGSTVYVVSDRAALTGDTLFVESVGRPDLADRAREFAGDLYNSLHECLLVLARRAPRAARPLWRRGGRPT